MQHDSEIDNAYFYYNGPFNIQIISGIARFLSELTVALHSERKKIYRVFIELTQNVALYSYDRTPLINDTAIGKGKVYVLNLENEFKCVTINRIQPDHADVLLNYCKNINETPVNELRNKKKELYRMSNSQDSGAHIGLIMIFLYSENLLNIELIEDDDNIKYIKIVATINKNTWCIV
jgi:hypothetical protein